MSRDILLNFRVSKNELDDIRDSARILGISVSRYLRIISCAPVDEMTVDKFNKINIKIRNIADDWMSAITDLKSYLNEESLK